MPALFLLRSWVCHAAECAWQCACQDAWRLLETRCGWEQQKCKKKGVWCAQISTPPGVLACSSLHSSSVVAVSLACSNTNTVIRFVVFRTFEVERVGQKIHHLVVFSVLAWELPQRSWKVRIRAVLVPCRGGLSAFENRKSLPDALLLNQLVHAFHAWEGLSPELSHCNFNPQLDPSVNFLPKRVDIDVEISRGVCVRWSPEMFACCGCCSLLPIVVSCCRLLPTVAGFTRGLTIFLFLLLALPVTPSLFRAPCLGPSCCLCFPHLSLSPS